MTTNVTVKVAHAQTGKVAKIETSTGEVAYLKKEEDFSIVLHGDKTFNITEADEQEADDFKSENEAKAAAAVAEEEKANAVDTPEDKGSEPGVDTAGEGKSVEEHEAEKPRD